MSRAEIIKASGTLIVAGSETTATLLRGALFYLLKSPSSLSKLTTELRTSFPGPAGMNVVNLARLSYLNACLQEGLRLYPPVQGILLRKTQPGGAVINGYHIPGNSTEQRGRSPSACPTSPLGIQLHGSRNVCALALARPSSFCIGQTKRAAAIFMELHLAMAEMRAILAQML
ncbi:Cytochrome P450 monooxygenase [Lachnellula willkommii]|uniref:Cytochrome P450 monooxygenase n=1 Tax=Lachnellula willkommii TaxID=215461 RepID=A0A559M8T3_9HELO|nr:Cytochrome P450 monooxygenase [Lachnellula willkommii]